MDAQNAAQSASSNPATAAPSKRSSSDPDQAKSPTLNKALVAPPRLSPAKAKDNKASAKESDTKGPANDDDGSVEVNSEAETIVLPGKDGHSPSKVRKVIKHEDKSDGEGISSAVSARDKKGSNGVKGGERGRERDKAADKGEKPGAGAAASTETPPTSAKRKNPQEKPRLKDGSSGLSSAPASPPAQNSRRSPKPSVESDPESTTTTSPTATAKDKSRPGDKLFSQKRKAPRAESDGEGESRKVRRQRTSVSVIDTPHLGNKSAGQRDNKSSSSSKSHDAGASSKARSVSPNPRAHRRSISSQLPAQSSNGLSHKKRRVPPPLQSTDYHSDESSTSNSPHPRGSKLRSLTTPATADSNVSPAKMAPHKKHLDAHGQTLLARICARGEYEVAKNRLAERPEDLNVADYAGNTPLQIAAINGCTDIVRLLVEAGCNLDCVNYDKDTPLLDAVDNGHLEVVKVLLEAGVNPRKANVNGEEPLDRVRDDMDNAAEIRAALVAAKQRIGERGRTSEDRHDHDAHSSHDAESPRRSPGAASQIIPSTRRGGTVRSTKTSNHLLYMPMDDKTLRQAAGRGDQETVERILQVRDNFDDPESMVAAARGGHDIIMELLLALGNANPDPGPLESMQRDFATPMLAAIGQENIKVIKLLLEQTKSGKFDPTRRFRGETYYEVARKRQGSNWKEEEHLLKTAYDDYKKKLRAGGQHKSPGNKELDRDAKRVRAEAKEEASKLHKRKASSPARDIAKTNATKKLGSPKDKRRAESFSTHGDDQTSPKRGPGRPRKEDRGSTMPAPDQEDPALPASKQPPKAKRTDSEAAAASSEGEAAKPRRKLVSARELKGERDKQRRASLTSNASSMKEPSSPNDSRHDEPHEKPKHAKLHDRTKALKRDESRDKSGTGADGSSKRHRSSATPPLHSVTDREGGEIPPKRRKLDNETKEKRVKPSASPEDRASNPRTAREGSATTGKSALKERDDDERKLPSKSKKTEAPGEHSRRESGKSTTSEKSIHVKSEEPDVEMPDAEPLRPQNNAETQADKDKADKESANESDALAQEQMRKEEEQKRREEEERRSAEAEQARKREEEEARRKKQEEEEQEAARRREEEERKRKEEEEEERKKREEAEKKRREEEEAAAAAAAAAEAKRREEERIRKEKEDEERRQREEEERMRREQLEREAAEEARRRREEEERKERAQREEMERRRRAAREAELRRIREEQERARLARLPPLLRWLDQCPNPKLPGFAEKFGLMQGVRYDCIRTDRTGHADGREQWLLNTQVALLLGEKDLELSRYTGWERVRVSLIAKKIIWRLEADRYALTTPSLYDIGREIPGYYQGEDPDHMSFSVMQKLRAEAWERFSAMELFFVKASELLYIVPTISHLRNVKLAMAYRELPDESQPLKWNLPQKWKADPGSQRFHGFAPRNKYYVNGQLVAEETPRLAQVSKTPFPETRVPRRGGLVAVTPEEPDYAQLCREQGLHHLLGGIRSPALPNGVHAASAVGTNVNRPELEANSLQSALRPIAPIINGGGQHSTSAITPSVATLPLVNGANVNGAVNGNSHHGVHP